MKQNLLRRFKSNLYLNFITLFVLSCIVTNKIKGQTTAFSANWPFTANLTASVTDAGSSNLTASTATFTSGTGGMFTGATSQTSGAFSGTGLSGKASTSCAATYDSVGSSSKIAPYMEFTLTPASNYKLSITSFTFAVSTFNAASGSSISAGYSIDNGVTFTGLASPTTTVNKGSYKGTANASPTGSTFWDRNMVGTTTSDTTVTLTFTVPACNVDLGKSFKLRVLIWRNNSNGSSGSKFSIASPTITGSTIYSPTPTISLDKSTLSAFNTNTLTASDAQIVNLSGINLTNDVTVTGSTKYEVSKTSATSGFGSTVTVSPSGGTVASTPIYIRVKSGAAADSAGTVSTPEVVTFSSTGASNKTTNCSGIVFTNYYNVSGAADLTAASSWTTDPTGATSINNPTNFPIKNQGFSAFNIISNSNNNKDSIVLLSTSKMLIGDGTNPITLTTDSILKGNVFLNNNATLIVKNNTSGLSLKTLDANSTVDYAGSREGVIQQVAASGYTFGKLIISNTTSAGFKVTNSFAVNTSTLIKSGAKIDIGSNNISGTGTFTTEAGSTLALASSSGLVDQSTSTGNIRNGTATRTFDPLTNVIYTTTSSSNPSLGSGFPSVVNNLEINSSADSVAIGKNISISGILKISNNYGLNTYTSGGTPYQINLLSTASGSASVAAITGTNATIHGIVKVNKYIGNQRGWYVLGNPLKSTSKTFFNNLATNSVTPFDIDFAKPTIKTFNSSESWTPATLGTEFWAGNTSIALFIKGIAGEGVNAVYNADPSNVTVSVKDSLNTAAPPVQNLDANKWYLIANPYAAPISLSTVLTSSTLTGAEIAWYDAKLNSTDVKVKAGGFKTGTASGTQGSATDVVIPSMEAFFIRLNSAGSLSIPKAAIYIGATNNGNTNGSKPADPGFDPDICSISSPTVVISTPTAVCEPATIDLTANAVVVNSTNVTNYTYFTDAAATAAVTNPSAINTSGTYYIKGTNDFGCAPSIQPVTLTINPKPILTGIDAPLLLRASSSVDLTLTQPTTTGGTWSSSDNTIAVVNSRTGKTDGILPGLFTASYSVTDVNGCANTVTQNITVEDANKPVVIANGSLTLCEGDSIELTSTELSGNQWYLNGNPISGETGVKYTAKTAGDYAILVNFGTVSKYSDAKTVIVNPIPTKLTLTDAGFCVGTLINLASPTSTNTLKWYDAISGGNALTNAPVSTNLTAGSYNYYISQLSTNGCESERTKLVVTANAIPSKPTISDVTYCTGNSATALSATVLSGNTAYWYTAATGGTYATSSPIPSTTSAGTTNYYVSQISTAQCESERTNVKVIVNATPAAPVVSNVSYCLNATSNNLTATLSAGNTAKWYTTASGATALTATPKPTTNAAGATDYFVSQVSSVGCEGARAKLNVTINATLPPTVSNVVYCNNDKATVLTATAAANSTLKWYSLASGGTALATAPTPLTTAIGNVDYFVSQLNTLSTCEGPRAKITVTTYPIPVPPIIKRDWDGTLLSSIAIGNQWFFNGNTINNAVKDRLTPDSTGKYGVKLIENGCISPMSTEYAYIFTTTSDRERLIQIYPKPNPFTDYINLNLPVPGIQSVNVTVYNFSTGQKIDVIKGLEPTGKVSLKHLLPGVYIIEVSSEDGRIREKFKMVKI